MTDNIPANGCRTADALEFAMTANASTRAVAEAAIAHAATPVAVTFL